MPELPEVENTVRRIALGATGKRICTITVRWKRCIYEPRLAEFKRILKNAVITAATRRGKYIVLHLKRRSAPVGLYYLFIHLRMAGSLYIQSGKLPGDKFSRVLFYLNNKQILCFRDIRKFGRLYLVRDFETVSDKLGFEPLDPAFSWRDLQAILCNKSGAIKPLLLNQKFIAGIGNIYADEALWRAKIHPSRKASSLIPSEIKRLYNSIRFVLLSAIESGGTDNGDNIVVGNYQPRAYGRDGHNCPRCKTKIEKIRIGQRGTHVCAKCQPIYLLAAPKP